MTRKKRTLWYRLDEGVELPLRRIYKGEDPNWKTLWTGSDIAVSYNPVYQEYRLWIFRGNRAYYEMTPRVAKELAIVQYLIFARLMGKPARLKEVISIKVPAYLRRYINRRLTQLEGK